MSKDTLNRTVLSKLDAATLVAHRNLEFYERIYDALIDSRNRDIVGQAMAQKRTFVDAMTLVMKNNKYSTTPAATAAHKMGVPKADAPPTVGHYLIEEDAFRAVLTDCLTLNLDEELSELLIHHMEAANIAVEAIKSTSLKI